jgi:type IV pilus assembly protein PilW
MMSKFSFSYSGQNSSPTVRGLGATKITAATELNSLRFSKPQSGYTLVELMIASFLGLLLIGGVLQLFLGSNQSYRVQNDLAVMQEEGRFALMFMKEQIQKAGFWQDPVAPYVDPVQNPINDDPGANGNDEFTIGYFGITDCNGKTYTSEGVILNRFYVDDKNNLMCAGSHVGSSESSPPAPIISNIESFQVLYGVEHTENEKCFSGAVNRYLNAGQLNTDPDIMRIYSVKIAFLMVSDEDILLESKPRTYNVLDKSIGLTDAKSRRVFQQTIFMPTPNWIAVGDPESLNACGDA